MRMEEETNHETNIKPEEEETCSLYVSRAVINNNQQQPFPDELSKINLENAIRSSEPTANWNVCQTSCGLIATFYCEADAEKLVQRGDIAYIFQGPVQVARFSARDARYRQSVFLRDVPWAIPLEDLSTALAKQGILTATIERCRQYVRVEVLDANHYENLLRQGLDFFGAARFSALPERANWWRSGGNNGNNNGSHSSTTMGAGGNLNDGSNSQQYDGVLQCYRCQGFWHVAANCRHLPRCVRCGELHSVEFCPRPRNNPTCCHCSGPHHAGFRQCPVRLQLLNATPISITLTANRTVGQYNSNNTVKSNVSQGQQVMTPNRQS